MIADLAGSDEGRWPAYVLAHRVRGVYSIPVVVAGEFVGALDFFAAQPGPLSVGDLTGAVAAAELAAIPLIDLLDAGLLAAVTLNTDKSTRHRRPASQLTSAKL